MKDFFKQNFIKFKDKAILTAWVTGIILLISMLWIFTQGVQASYLMRSVNKVFISNNDTRRAAAAIQQKSDNANIMGYWYSMINSTDKLYVFAIFNDGILVPLGAIVSAEGKVSEIMPLSAHAVHVFNTLPEIIIQIYTNRIEASLSGKKEVSAIKTAGAITIGGIKTQPVPETEGRGK